MPVQPIRLFGDPVLRTPAEPVLDFDKELRTLVKDLQETMLDAPGVGLAAPQIGVGLRVFTYHVDDVLGHLVNPTLDLTAEEQEDDEGCLSFPGAFVECARPDIARVTGPGLDGSEVRFDGDGLLARCLQHETDHTLGTVFGDRLTTKARKKLQKQHDKAAEEYPADWPLPSA